MHNNIQRVPFALFAYSRPRHLSRVLDCLRRDEVPVIFAFSDGPRSRQDREAVDEVRHMLRSVDWCEIVVKERSRNLGLGRSILSGVDEVLQEHESVIVCEDDIVCVEGTYSYLCAALEQYRSDKRVMSVTGWTHPDVIPSDVSDQPYFDGRAECWMWGTWSRVWPGMRDNARTLMRRCTAKGIDINRYGIDLPHMAMEERRRNIWAVRLLYLHMLEGGLCLRPPWSMVEHIGFDGSATNAAGGNRWTNPVLKNAPPVPKVWPEPSEHAACAGLWQRACGADNRVGESPTEKPNDFKRVLKQILPPLAVSAIRKLRRCSMPVVQQAEVPDWEYIPEGWDYALRHPEVKGWNMPEVVSSCEKRWGRFVDRLRTLGQLSLGQDSSPGLPTDMIVHNEIMTFGYVLGQVARKLDSISILDWGGGLGWYGMLARVLSPGVQVDYHCRELPLMAAAGRRLFPEGCFHEDDTCLERTYDLVLAGTSVHYEPQWQNAVRRLVGATGRYLYLAGVPVVMSVPSFVFVQRPYRSGYNTEYLGWCVNREALLKSVSGPGLQLVREFIVGHKPVICGAPEQNEYSGFLWEIQTHDLRSTESGSCLGSSSN